MTLYVTADLHLGHRRIIEYAKRPYKDLHEMTCAMVDVWNATVGDRDTVFVLGDFHLGIPDGALHRLKGRLHLVQGNHDSKKTIKHPRWESVSHIKYQTHAKTTFVMCHYPLEVWKQSRYGAVHLHGHCHGKGRKVLNRFDVGWDVYGKPVPLDVFLAAGAPRGPYQHD